MAAKTAAEPTACTCSQFEADGKTTGCTATTARLFAPGHDAKLKSFLIRAGAEGHQVTRTDASGHRTITSAADAAKGFKFAYMITSGIKRAQDKAAAKKDKGTGRKKVATKKPQVVTAKVGRWLRTGVIEGDEFVYTDARGNERRTAKFTVQG
ncbi:hypothetical protein [Streptomyces pini]|uniref:Uncharacterized protein n=1 Tax=Streptomyces pini TaxID=1520580 RepID=A0A1I4EGS5_9ACTN|nr:hypothetical protein [Streptomyces pini]SFL04978.1 hypothetical protein SAMN05192584_11272 [Streptomyces pini]